jgi:hypothetical protein
MAEFLDTDTGFQDTVKREKGQQPIHLFLRLIILTSTIIMAGQAMATMDMQQKRIKDTLHDNEKAVEAIYHLLHFQQQVFFQARSNFSSLKCPTDLLVALGIHNILGVTCKLTLSKNAKVHVCNNKTAKQLAILANGIKKLQEDQKK